MRRRPLRDTALRPVRERPDGVALGSSPTRASVTVSMIEVSHLARLRGHLELLVRPWGEGDETTQRSGW